MGGNLTSSRVPVKPAARISDMTGHNRHNGRSLPYETGSSVGTRPTEREVRVVLEIFSTHRINLARQLLVEHPNGNLHFAPTYSSWVNQVEGRLSKRQ